LAHEVAKVAVTRRRVNKALVATIFDVARQAGVSTSTVSRVMNGNDRVDPRLAARVTRVARELNYRPNQTARGLRLRQNRVWALVISDIRTGPFFADVVRGVEDVAYEAGYAMFLCNTDEDPAKEAGYLELAIAENVAGVILTPSSPSTDLASLFEAGIHVVVADRKLPGHRADTVVGDNVAGAMRGVEHLLQNGYRRVACITGPLSTTTGSERLVGYRLALEQAGAAAEDSLVRAADFREQGGYQSMQELLEREPRPDAVFVANNRMAAGALQAIEEAKLAIPDEIGVVGFDEISWTNLLRTALTTVTQPAYDLGHESARLLLSRLDGYSGSPRTVVLPTTLHVRASSLRGTDHGAGPLRAGHQARAEQRPSRRPRAEAAK
jgi:LacI family transcriptional regulator